jgi:GWxTD domain-containing protein
MKNYALPLVAAMIISVFAGACGTKQQVRKEPPVSYEDSFYQTARFIMTREESDIYKHLPDREARKEFIEEFWKKRDPDPVTEENENRLEFEERIRYADKWFRETPRGSGWDTERGRILLQLGFPDRRAFGEKADTYRGRLITSKRYPMEVWEYYRHHLVLVFADTNDSGRLRLTRIPSNLQTVMDLTRFSLDLREQDKLKTAFRFKASFKNDILHITIPIKKISFEEKGGEMIADFGITLYVYLNSRKIDEITTLKSLRLDKEKLLRGSAKNTGFKVPYPLREKGKYYFDVVIEDKSSTSRYRNFVTHKKK